MGVKEMKLRYQFEFMEVGGQLVGVPESDDFNGMLKVNETTRQIFEKIPECRDREELLEAISHLHTDETKEKLAPQLDAFLNRLIEEGLLEE